MILNLCFFFLMNGIHLNFGLDSLTITAMPGKTITYNEGVTFECVYTYGEDREVTLFNSAIWTKNGETIGTIDGFGEPKPATTVTFQKGPKYIKTSVTLSAVNCSHIGNYSCAFVSLITNLNRTAYKLKKHIFLDIRAVRLMPTISSEDQRTLYTENDVVSFTCLAVTGRPPVSSKMKITFTNGTTKPIQTTSTVMPMQDSCIKQERLKATIKLTRHHKAIVCTVTEELSSELPLSFTYTKKTGQSKKDQSKKATVVAVIVGVLVFLVGIGGGLLAYKKYKHPKQQNNIEDIDKSDNENSSSSSGDKGSRRKRSKRSKRSRK